MSPIINPIDCFKRHCVFCIFFREWYVFYLETAEPECLCRISPSPETCLTERSVSRVPIELKMVDEFHHRLRRA